MGNFIATIYKSIKGEGNKTLMGSKAILKDLSSILKSAHKDKTHAKLDEKSYQKALKILNSKKMTSNESDQVIDKILLKVSGKSLSEGDLATARLKASHTLLVKAMKDSHDMAIKVLGAIEDHSNDSAFHH